MQGRVQETYGDNRDENFAMKFQDLSKIVGLEKVKQIMGTGKILEPND